MRHFQSISLIGRHRAAAETGGQRAAADLELAPGKPRAVVLGLK